MTPTDSRFHWTFLVRLALAASVSLAATSPASADLVVTIVKPAADGYWPRQLPVEVTVVSTYSLASVVAQVDGQQAALAPAQNVTWTGTLDLSGIASGRKTLTVTARDVFDNQTIATREFSLDDPPGLTVISPQQGEVASPGVRLAATCSDDGASACTVEVEVEFQGLLGPVAGRIDLVRSLAALDGRDVELRFRARDASGQQRTVIRTVHAIVPGPLVERHRLVPGGGVLDLSLTRALYGAGNSVLIRDLTSGADAAVADITGRSATLGFLTARGAIFQTYSSTAPYADVREWRDGTLLDHGGAASSYSLAVAEPWAIWNAATPGFAQELVRRDLGAGSTSVVSSTAGNWRNDVASNGDVVFWGSADYQIHRYRGGSTTDVTSDAFGPNTYPLTDGERVLYRKTPGGLASSIALNAGAGEVVLDPSWGDAGDGPDPGRAYQVADGWVAFTKRAGSNRQAWTRDASGTLRQVSFLGGTVQLVEPRAVDPLGRVLFVGDAGTAQTFLGLGSGTPETGTRLGPPMRAWWIGDQWWLAFHSLVLGLSFTPGCAYDVPASLPEVALAGAPIEVPVTALGSCGWAGVSEVPWITATGVTTGTGTGTTTWTVAPNAGAARDGAVWLAGRRVTVTQAGTAGAADTDGDLLPDAWETLHGLNPLSDAASDGAAGDPDGDLQSNRTEFLQGTNPSGHDRYLAEGATSTMFDTRLAVFNPGDVATVATLTYLRSGQAPVTQDVPVGARTRVTIDPRQALGPGTSEFSTHVASSQPLVVDRTLTWAYGFNYGAHAETALTAPALRWYLAEGATHSSFNLFYLLQNPNASVAQVRVRYLRQGGAPLEKTYALPPNSRTNIWVDVEQFPEGSGTLALASADVSAVFDVLNGQPIIVERALYADVPGQFFGAGHGSAGVTAPALEWFLAEGATGPWLDLYVLVANPGETDADVEATFLLPDGTTLTRSYTVPASSRFTVFVDGEDALLANTAVSTRIRSTNNVPVVVERSLWWPGTGWYEAHNSAGATATGTLWALAEGEVDATRAMETYVLVANTSAWPATVKVTVCFEDGSSVERTFGPDVIPANSRFNVPIGAYFPAAAGKRFGTLVEALGDTPAQIVVERAMYWDATGQPWAAGTNALATRVR